MTNIARDLQLHVNLFVVAMRDDNLSADHKRPRLAAQRAKVDGLLHHRS